MAKSWPRSIWKRGGVHALDLVGRAAWGVLRPRRPRDDSRAPERILVVELWQLGDVVLITPFLAALRGAFPAARISVLGKPHAAVLLSESGLADEVIVAEIPWTRKSGKYDPREYTGESFRRLVQDLRARRFDVSFDARMDLRNNFLSALLGARRRIGLAYGGGDWLLTDAVRANPTETHRVEDWLSLLRPFGVAAPSAPRCLLRTSPSEREHARQLLSSLSAGSTPIAIHPGASHAGKRWPLANFLRLAQRLKDEGHSVILLENPTVPMSTDDDHRVTVVRPQLRELMAVLEQCVLLVCNDSGPMHIAAALGTPTVAIFERGNPAWFKPVGEDHVVVYGELAGVDVSAAPTDEAPRNPVSVDAVHQAVETSLAAGRQRESG